MCSLCLKWPCDPRCPNADEPEPVYVCCKCGEGIYEEDKYFDVGDGTRICYDCLDNMDPEDLLELVGEELKQA